MEPHIDALVSPDFLDGVAAYFGTRGPLCRLISKVENFVYAIEADGRTRILRLTHSSHRTLGQVQAELDWIEHLAAHGAPVCRVVPARTGHRVESMVAGDGEFFAVCFEHAPGGAVDPKSEAHWNAALFTNWGRTMGRLHALAQDYAVAPGRPKRIAWFEEELLRTERHVPAEDRAVVEAGRGLIERLHALETPPDAYGLIHSDLHHGNFFVDGTRLWVFDFDDSMYNWFVHDIAIALYYAMWTVDDADVRDAFGRHFLESLLEGYRQSHAIDAAWLEHLGLFLKLRDVTLYSFFHKKYGAQGFSERQAAAVAQLRARVLADRACVELDFASF